MLHHVRPRRNAPFQPNHHLEVTPEFLRMILAHVRSRGIDIVTADEMHRRLTQHDFSRRFACFTFDDGYRETATSRCPRCANMMRHSPSMSRMTSRNGTGHLWWVALERVIASTERIDSTIGDTAVRLDTRTVEQKQGSVLSHSRSAARAAGRPRCRARDWSGLCARYSVDQSIISRGAVSILGRIESRSPPIRWSRSALIPSVTVTSQSEARSRPFRRSPSAGHRSKLSCSVRSSISPIPTATGRHGSARVRYDQGGRFQYCGHNATGHDLS